MFHKIIHTISVWGTNRNLPASINRQITLCNQIALAMLVLTLFFTIANAMRFDVMKMLTSVCNTCTFALVIFLNKYQYHLAGRLLACLVIPTSNTLSQILARLYYPQDIFITQYFGDRIFILASSLFPLLLFNPKREKVFFWFSYLYIIALLVLYDPLHWLLNIEIHRANIPQYLRGYSFINLTFFIVTIGITLAILFLKNMNLVYEGQIIQANKELEAQKEEILTQNTELQEQQCEITAQRDYIEEQHNQTKNSIRVAHTIQNAILPTQERLDAILQRYFVLYIPRDVVSGDFYWVSEVQDWKILVVADCTGHGVPGAFMTLIAHTLLDKIVNIGQVSEPHSILQKLHEDVVLTLNQKVHSNNMGMDALVLAWQPYQAQTTTLKFEGAKIDMYYILPEEAKVHTLHATRKAIGGDQNEQKTFQTKTLILPTNTQIYVGSDGLLDQNNPQRKRLGTQKLHQHLLENAHISLPEQGKNIETMLKEYQQDSFQRDDILLIGYKL